MGSINNNDLPAFGGIISCKILHVDYLAETYNQIKDKPNIKLYANTNNSIKSLTYYVFNDSSFLWTGGSDIKGFNETDFNYKELDRKFVYVDFSNGNLQIFTDHYSKIPLLYLFKNETLYFASSLAFLLKLLGSDKINTDYNGLLLYFNYGFSFYDNSLIEGVESLAGGQCLSFIDGVLKKQSYTNFFDIRNYKINTNSLNQNIHLIDKYLLETTKRTIENYNNIGITLSGGVDSGYLAQKINECGKSFNAYTLGFQDGYNEFDRIDYLSNTLNFKAQKIIINPEQIISNYLEVSAYSSFPVGFNNSILNFIYKNAASDGIELLFDGDGADRLFLGMNKYLELEHVLNLYAITKKAKVHKILTSFFKVVNHPISNKLWFYFMKFNNDFPFYGERQLQSNLTFNKSFEIKLNDLALPKELKELSGNIDDWLFFSLFSVYFTPAFFFHTPYELQLKHNIVSNPQFWSDNLVNLALNIPTNQKFKNKTTKYVLREAAKLKIDDGYWDLSKIGLQNSYNYLKNSKIGLEFVNSYVGMIKASDEYKYLKESLPVNEVDAERLLPYYIWKERLF